MSDLLEVGDRVVALARAGEEVEAVVLRSSDTEVRVYEGEIESFSSAQSQGVGVRVVVDGRQGFAYAGTLDDDVLAETVAEARDNAAFGEPDEFNGLATPDGVPVADLDLYREALLSFPTDDKISLAQQLETAVKGADPRITGVESAEYVDSVGDMAVVTSTGIRTSGRRRPATSPPTSSRRRTATPRRASASRWGASRRTSTWPGPPPTPPTGPRASSVPPSPPAAA